MGNPSEIIIYKVIRMNSNSITNLPIPTLPHEAANKLYVDSNSRKILQGYVPPLRSMGGRNNIKLGFIATASSQLNNYYRASNAFVFIRAVEQVVNGLVIMKRETSGFKLSAPS